MKAVKGKKLNYDELEYQAWKKYGNSLIIKENSLWKDRLMAVYLDGFKDGWKARKSSNER